MRIAFYTLGCKVNQYETELLSALFHKNGYDIIPYEQDADVYVINSCTVTSTGDSKTRKTLHRLRREHPNAVIALTGCFPQAFPDAAETLSEADIVMGAKSRRSLVDAVGRFAQNGERIIDITPHTIGEEFEEMEIHSFTERTRAFVKIEDGCERYCAYCIIPKARGFVRSKPLDALKQEVSSLADNGYLEVVLVGINLSSYGKDLGLRLVDAVEAACGIEKIKRVRLGSLEPELLSDDDIGRLAKLDKLCPQFHLSLQSGCDETLRRMRRHYDTKEYSRIVNKLRAEFPGCAVTTDIMVGFPGETDEEFQKSLAFVKEVSFAKAHVFSYSVREGTSAAEMKDQIDPAVKEQRSRLMIDAANRSAEAFLKEQIGSVAEVLFESRHHKLGYEGYTDTYCPVFVRSENPLGGTINKVKIADAVKEGCIGELI